MQIYNYTSDIDILHTYLIGGFIDKDNNDSRDGFSIFFPYENKNFKKDFMTADESDFDLEKIEKVITDLITKSDLFVYDGIVYNLDLPKTDELQKLVERIANDLNEYYANYQESEGV